MQKHVKKGCQNIIKIYEKWTLELNKKRCLKTYSNKAKNVQKMIPNSGSKSEGIFGVASRGAPLAAHFIFYVKNGFPALPKMCPMLKITLKRIPKSQRIQQN